MAGISRRKFITAVAALGGTAFAAKSVWYERYRIETNEFFMEGAKPGADNLKIVQISDLHIRSVHYGLRDLAGHINSIKPDLILFSGDSVDRRNKLGVLDDFLGLLDSGVPKAAILGNWEHWSTVPLEKLEQVYGKHNCTLLVNRSARFGLGGASVSLTGIDDLVAGSPNFRQAIASHESADYTIIMAHCPEHRDIFREEMTDFSADMVLSGHTHGGQIAFFGFAPLRPRGSGHYVSGWYRDEKPHMYVSKGIGTSRLPVRFGARAEIAVFNFKKMGV